MLNSDECWARSINLFSITAAHKNSACKSNHRFVLTHLFEYYRLYSSNLHLYQGNSHKQIFKKCLTKTCRPTDKVKERFIFVSSVSTQQSEEKLSFDKPKVAQKILRTEDIAQFCVIYLPFLNILYLHIFVIFNIKQKLFKNAEM